MSKMSKLANLIKEMTYKEPKKRPLFEKVVHEFACIRNDLSGDAHRPLESSWWHWVFRR
jgi:hypothetical protein